MTTDKVIWLNAGFLPIYFGFCPSKKAWNREMKRLGVKDEPYPTSAGRCTSFWNLKDANDCTIVTINPKMCKDRDPNEVVGLLIHEAVHVYQKALESMGEKKPGIEMEAYAIQYISQQLISTYSETIGAKLGR